MKRYIDDAPTTWLDVGHARIACWRVGQGPDLVFVHGWPLTSATFRHVVPKLADRYTCHLIDLPGCGRTEHTEAMPFGLREHAHTVARAVDRLGLSSYGLVAHDSGAAIARLVAAAHRERVFGLVMGNTELPRHHPWQLSAFLTLGKMPGGVSMLQFSLRVGVLRRSRWVLGGCFTDAKYGDGEFYDLFVAPLVAGGPPLDGQLALLRTFDTAVVDELEAVHRRITAPACLIWGPRDPFFPLERARATLDQFPGGATLEVIESGGLLTHEDHPDAFAAVAGTFLDEHASRSTFAA